MKVLALDVSGNFNEGKGISGLCLMIDGKPKELYDIKARDFNCAEAYWQAHVNVIRDFKPDIVVMEGYRLYNHAGKRASTQANSELETPQLIGAIKLWCYMHDIPVIIQYASEVKSRWNDDVLVNTGYIDQSGKRYFFKNKITNDHKRDALRHALHYGRYGAK